MAFGNPRKRDWEWGTFSMYLTAFMDRNLLNTKWSENIIDVAFNDADIALTTISKNIGNEEIAAKIEKMRDDLRKIMTAR